MIELKSRRHTVDDLGSAIELCYANGWTDGLPVIPPTAERIAAMLDAGGFKPDEQLSFIENRQVSVTAEKVAINAVMAGCKPEYMPVITATIRALADPKYGYHGPATSTGGSAVFMLVNGPIAKQLNINSGDNVFGQGWRANATIGRSIRLFLLNVLGGIPGQLDRSTLGHPGKFTFCVAEDEEDSPWLPLSVERGVPAGVSAVTSLQVESPMQIMNEWTHDPREICDTYAAAMRSNMLLYSIWEGNYALVIAKQHREIFAAAGWTKQNIRE